MSYGAKTVGVMARVGCTLLLATMGCVMSNQGANTRPTPAQIGSAEGAVNAARLGGGAKYANSAPFLAAAEHELASGKQSLSAGDGPGATWMMARAAADADLSRALAMRAHEEGEATSSEKQLEETREQLKANTSSTPSTPAIPEAPETSAPEPANAPSD